MTSARETHESRDLVTGGPELRAAYLRVDDSQVHLEYVPVIGWLRKRAHFDDGTWMDEFYPAIINDEFHMVSTLQEVYEDTANTQIIGLFSPDQEPGNDQIDEALLALQHDLRRKWIKAEEFAPQVRDMNRRMYRGWGKVIAEAVAS